MSVQVLVDETLEFLFHGYISNHGTGMFDIGPIAAKHGQDPNKVGELLVSGGFINNYQYRPTTFVGQISEHGIEQVKPFFFIDKQDEVIAHLVNSEYGFHGILSILDMEQVDFQIAFDIGKYMEYNDYVEFQGGPGDVFVRITLKGKEYYENNKATFI